ncbi:MAG: hypothetical protein V1889_01960 [archaeon]
MGKKKQKKPKTNKQTRREREPFTVFTLSVDRDASEITNKPKPNTR